MSSFFPSLTTVAKGAFATTVGLGTLSAGLLYYGQSYLIYPSAFTQIGDDGPPAEPASYGLHHELVELKTKDGEILRCYLLPQKKELPKATKFRSLPKVPISAIEGATESGYSEMTDEEVLSQRPTVIMFHGNGGNAGHRIPLGMMFQQVMRCNVLGVEYRGYGESTGTPSENGLAIDAVTALEFVRGDPRLRNTPVILYGQSIGGAVSIDLASRFPGEISGLILENTFLSLRLLVPHVLPLLGPFRWLCHQRWESAGKGIPREMNVLLLSGQSDTLVPPKHMKYLRKIFSARPHTRRTLGLSPLSISQEGKNEDEVNEERTQFILFPEGTHNNTTAQHGYWNRIGDFVAEVGKEWREQQKQYRS
ncbi:Alpha/Beta hydrolase protein [Lentinula raphanica]|uniref:Alpha/Beta hydrolase protein n=1 Tax=Lentinula raphanica TaxID=153919 RepID=A0AA38UIK5_9AGAR|nr:Alpha/Beta hydrolase protein [Lentinula raphanica]